jgi:hypothetical protein
LDIEARINKMMTEEKNTGIHFSYLNRDIQALANLRKSILKQRDWELQHEDLIQDENEKNIQKNIKKKFDKLMNVLGDDGRNRLVSMTTRFLEMADKIAVPMAVDAEGNFVRVDKDE